MEVGIHRLLRKITHLIVATLMPTSLVSNPLYRALVRNSIKPLASPTNLFSTCNLSILTTCLLVKRLNPNPRAVIRIFSMAKLLSNNLQQQQEIPTMCTASSTDLLRQSIKHITILDHLGHQAVLSNISQVTQKRSKRESADFSRKLRRRWADASWNDMMIFIPFLVVALDLASVFIAYIME
jgi:hypothetical protein